MRLELRSICRWGAAIAKDSFRVSLIAKHLDVMRLALPSRISA